MLPEINPELTPEQIEQLELARRMIPKLKEQLRKAQTAGLDVTTLQAEIDTLQIQLDKLYRVYVRRTTSSPSS